MFETIEVTRGPRVTVIWLNRPAVHNAINAVMVEELMQAITEAAHSTEVCAIVLASRGDAFCSGTDLNWYRSAWSADDPSRDAPDADLFKLLKAIDESPVPVIARVNGHCVGVGVGLAAAADIAVASHGAEFTQSETCLGMTPHLAAPYLTRAMGARSAARWLMTGETFSAAEAWRLGLVHEICDVSELDARINEILGHLMTAEPGAVQSTRRMSKKLAVAGANASGEARAGASVVPEVNSELAKEGVSAFLEKRWPSWAPDELK
jgi:methylglutaconyl-CoA hydratase